MPEGHSVHRIAKQFAANFVGRTVTVTSPQGRFSAGAALLTGLPMVDAVAIGKQMFLEFPEDKFLRVHLGIYGAWDFSGDVKTHPDIQLHGKSKLGQTGMRPVDRAAEDSVASIGAPRKTRLRMAETDAARDADSVWPPDPVGQVRARLLTDTVCADLRGPTVCSVITGAEKEQIAARLGPDPANCASDAEKQRFIARAGKRATPIGLALMDQPVVAGIGNVYRAELLFRAGLNPYTPGKELSAEQLGELWDDWVRLLASGITVGQMITKDGLSEAEYAAALVERDARHWVYKKEGQPCERCGTIIKLETAGGRKLYWCPGCQK